MSKYRNVWTEYNGRKYQSKAEARRARELDLLVRQGHILTWQPQPKYELGIPENVYRADFEVIGHDDRIWAEDVKGVETATFRRWVRLWRRYGPHRLIVLYATGASGWKRVEVAPPESVTP